MNDNVTPFPTPPKKPAFDVRDPKHLTFLVYGLTVTSFAISWVGNTFVSWIGIGLGIAALAISASKRDEGAFWARSHFEFALRTLIIGGVTWFILSVIGIIPILGWVVAWAMKPLVMIWILLRSAVGFVRAADAKVIANPVTWLI